jgi:hypothetical protein
MAEQLKLPGVKGAFAVGLAWRHEDTVPKGRVLRELSHEKGRWGVVYRTTAGTVQVGFCAPVDGVRIPGKLRSLAAMIADSRPQPWMGLFRLGEDRYWYIAVRNGQEIIPDGDQVGTYEAVRQVRESHLRLGDWNEFEGTPADLAAVVLTTPRRPALRDLRARPRLKFAVTAGVLMVSGISALYIKQAFDREATLALQKVAADADLTRQLQQPLPSAVLAACAHAWHAEALAVNGWVLNTWKFRVSATGVPNTSSAWQRAGGLASHAPGVLASDGQHADRSTLDESGSGTGLALRTGKPVAQATAERAIWSLAQTYGMTLTIEPERPGNPPSQTSQGVAAASAQPAAPWLERAVQFTTAMPPWKMQGSAFDAVPGLRVTEVSTDTSSGLWQVSGTLYTIRAAATAQAGAA